MLAFGALSAAALARSRTIEALVLKRSDTVQRQNVTKSSSLRGSGSFVRTVTGHARLARYTSRNENDLRVGQRIAQARSGGIVAGHHAVGVDVAQVGRDACPKQTTIVLARLIALVNMGGFFGSYAC